MKNKSIKILIALAAVCVFVFGCLGITGCNYCAHQLEVIPKKESTCVEHGYGYSYRCKKCNKLFAYDTQNGLYEISAAETLPLGGHTLPENPEGKLGVKLKEGITEATSVFDYELTANCGVCGNEYAVPDEHMALIVPPNIRMGHAGESGEKYSGEYAYDEASGRPYTQISFSSTTKNGTPICINPVNFAKPTDGKPNSNKKYDEKYEWVDSSKWGAYQRFPLYVPFTADETRYVYYIIHNTSDEAIQVGFSIQGDNFFDVTIQPGEVKPLLVTGTRTYNTNLEDQYIRVTNPASTKSTLGKKMSIEVTGFFYVPGDVAKLDIDSMPEKLEYAEGETFDPSGLKVYATYTDYCLGKSLYVDQMQIDCAGRPLTKDDKVVTIMYGGKRAQLYITVN